MDCGEIFWHELRGSELDHAIRDRDAEEGPDAESPSETRTRAAADLGFRHGHSVSLVVVGDPDMARAHKSSTRGARLERQRIHHGDEIEPLGIGDVGFERIETRVGHGSISISISISICFCFCFSSGTHDGLKLSEDAAAELLIDRRARVVMTRRS